MTSRSRKTWSAFAACVALIVAALCWVTWELQSLVRAEAAAKATRVALWRMDSAFASIVAQEGARSPSDYPPATGGPTPAPAFAPFRLYFSIDAEGRASTPEMAPFVPALRPPRLKNESDSMLAFGKRADDQDKKQRDESEDETKTYESRLQAGLERHAESGPSDGRAAAAAARWAEGVPMPPLPPATRAPPPAEKPAPEQTLDLGQVQIEAAKNDYQSRAKMAQELKDTFAMNQTVLPQSGALLKLEPQSGLVVIPNYESGPLEPRWIKIRDPVLFLVRTVRERISGQSIVQGIWIDWPKLEEWFLEKARVEFPEGRLVAPPEGAETANLLASIPAAFAPGALDARQSETATPTRLILGFAWFAALGAIAAVGGVLAAALSLGERRGRFVSAVTHELRTPLTTFRMYSQMLADGMVPEAAKPEYLATLRDESERLTRVVESVLLYSRLEEGRGGAHREKLSCRALVDRLLPALAKRATDGGMMPATVVDVAEAAAVELDVQAVEQILLNLVDNACKYAAPADPRLELRFRTTAGTLEVLCRDHGPGIPENEREAVFLPFRRGAKDAAGTTPGVGLGVALARGLARALGGSLALDGAAGSGASFRLAIPLSSTA